MADEKKNTGNAGKGRKKGSKNKTTIEREHKLEYGGITAREYFESILNSSKPRRRKDEELVDYLDRLVGWENSRASAAHQLLNYHHPRLQAIEHSGGVALTQISKVQGRTQDRAKSLK